MEPFRIFVDRWVDFCGFYEFGSAEKHKVLEIFNQPFSVDGENRRLDDCIMIYTRSVFKAIQTGNPYVIKFCSIK